MYCTIRVRVRKTCAAFVVDDQVDIALAVAALLIREPVPLVGQRPQRLDEQPERVNFESELACPGLEQLAGATQHVTDVVAFELLVALTERIALQEELNQPRAIL